VRSVRAALVKRGLRAVGHTAYYLPFASSFESIRRAAVEEAKRCLEVFSKLGIAWMNVHPTGTTWPTAVMCSAESGTRRRGHSLTSANPKLGGWRPLL
jgi:sugar phosphate isomerase/epimerase